VVLVASAGFSRCVAAGFLAYLKILATLRNLRDHSKLNEMTPIITGMSAWWGAPGEPKYENMTGSNMEDTIAFLPFMQERTQRSCCEQLRFSNRFDDEPCLRSVRLKSSPLERVGSPVGSHR